MTALALLYLRKVPGIAWAILLAIALLTAAAVGLYQRGEHTGERKVHKAALVDSTTKQVTVVAKATRASDSTVAVAAKAVRISTAGRVHTRALIEAAKDTIPPAVIAAIDSQLRRDSTTIAVQAAAIETQHAERLDRIQLDTLREHAEHFEAPSGGISATDVVVTVGIVATIVEAVRLVLQLLHH
jgi:hypothetical protein